jgi:hypothetical protein
VLPQDQHTRVGDQMRAQSTAVLYTPAFRFRSGGRPAHPCWSSRSGGSVCPTRVGWRSGACAATGPAHPCWRSDACPGAFRFRSGGRPAHPCGRPGACRAAFRREVAQHIRVGGQVRAEVPAGQEVAQHARVGQCLPRCHQVRLLPSTPVLEVRCMPRRQPQLRARRQQRLTAEVRRPLAVGHQALALTRVPRCRNLEVDQRVVIISTTFQFARAPRGRYNKLPHPFQLGQTVANRL